MRLANYFLLILTMAVAGCNVDTSLNTKTFFPLDSQMEIDPYATFGVVLSHSDTIKFETLDIQDSRCPADVTCIWAGNLSITVLVDLGHLTDEVDLCVGDCRNGSFKERDTANFTLQGKDYGIILSGSDPYPTTKTESYKLLLEVFDY